jgi:hypothetical protein
MAGRWQVVDVRQFMALRTPQALMSAGHPAPGQIGWVLLAAAAVEKAHKRGVTG